MRPHQRVALPTLWKFDGAKFAKALGIGPDDFDCDGTHVRYPLKCPPPGAVLDRATMEHTPKPRLNVALRLKALAARITALENA